MSVETSTGTVAGKARAVGDLARLIDATRTPTPEQAEVVGWGTRPALVVAGAGSGKTETLSMRMVYLLDHAREMWGDDLAPDQILCLTFTRKAAAEIAERARLRIDAVFGIDAARPEPVVATYNGYAAGLVAEHGLRVGVDPDSVVLTDASLWQMAAEIVEGWVDDVGAEAATSSVVRAIPALAAQLLDHGVAPAELAALCGAIADEVEALGATAGRGGGPNKEALGEAAAFRGRAALAPLVEEFARRKRAGGFLDFADQIALAGRLSRLAAVRAVERSRYRVVLLDEFQDTSHGQLDLFATMFGDRHPVMAVGDPHQAIYGFRGASADSLPAFVERFGGSEAVGVLTLSTSWRNSAGILGAANASTAPLRDESRVPVPPLRPREGEAVAPVPAVTARMYRDTVAEAVGVVDELLARREAIAGWRKGRPEDDPDRPVTAAILCRARRQFPAFVEALRARGVRYQVVGIGGLLDVPAIVDLVAVLEAAHDPSRGDSLMRLLASDRFALGAADLAALAEWSRELAGPRETREAEPSIVDALEDAPDPTWVSREGRRLSASARDRLAEARALLAAVRAHTYLPLGELVAFAARLSGLDIECAVARPAGDAEPALEAFADVARGFSVGAEHATLGAFLAWLDAAREEESKLDTPVAPPDPAAVQVQTVHAAKGLEWDVVAVPGLVDGRFPKALVPTPTRSGHAHAGWTTGISTLPWPLRRDSAALPAWNWKGATDLKDYRARKEEFREAAGAFRVAEDRRLFYVALTRAFSSVILSGAWWDAGSTPFAPSPYVRELVDAGVVSEADWDTKPETNPLDEAPPRTATWPPEPTAASRAIRELAAEVDAELSGGAKPEAGPLPYEREVDAMLAEAAERSGSPATVALPAHLSATALVALARDPAAYAAALRRPLPAEPTVAAERGSVFHAWVEAHYGTTPLWDADEPDEDADLDRLREAFLASEWARRTPTHVEADVELPVGGVTLRSRIDAVFPPGDGLDRVTVVDWKTGRPPADADERAAREVQLATYRLAWSRFTGVPLGDVDAVFFYASTGQTVAPERLLSEEEILALLEPSG